MGDIIKTVGERVRSYRIQGGYTQANLAERSGLHHTFIGQIERGEKNVTIESIAKIASALNITLEELFKNIVIINDEARDINPIPSECYNLINNLSKSEQIAIYEILKKIIAYKQI